jgi:hypothetical protein
MPNGTHPRISKHRNKWLLRAVLLLVIAIVAGQVVTQFFRYRMQQERQEQRWFEQEVKASNEFKHALINMVVFVDDRQRFFEGGLAPEDERALVLKTTADKQKLDDRLQQAEREAEPLKGMLPGLSNRQRFQNRLSSLLKSFENTRVGAERVAKAKSQHEISEALNVFAEQPLPDEQ